MCRFMPFLEFQTNNFENKGLVASIRNHQDTCRDLIISLNTCYHLEPLEFSIYRALRPTIPLLIHSISLSTLQTCVLSISGGY
ncbi:hypothetical protein HanIR_Chr02g0089791 [Helianthus annuus]|nr:hypothetical protein HanIR_Chr02g0089791 [Helianthus annuus]